MHLQPCAWCFSARLAKVWYQAVTGVVSLSRSVLTKIGSRRTVCSIAYRNVGEFFFKKVASPVEFSVIVTLLYVKDFGHPRLQFSKI